MAKLLWSCCFDCESFSLSENLLSREIIDDEVFIWAIFGIIIPKSYDGHLYKQGEDGVLFISIH